MEKKLNFTSQALNQINKITVGKILVKFLEAGIKSVPITSKIMAKNKYIYAFIFLFYRNRFS